ncbi:MAG: helix-turn-helix transcriptional regulator [Bacillota bacterium]
MTNIIYENNKTTFAERLKEIMEERGLTPTTLGKELGMFPAMISGWCIKNPDVQLSTLVMLKNHFGCSVEFLAGNIDIDTEMWKFETCNFAESLKINLNEKGVSEYKMLKDLQISRSVLHNWKHGGEPRLSRLSQIANYLEITIDYLIGRC